LLAFLKELILSFQDFLFLARRAFKNLAVRPHYADDVYL